MYGRTVPCGEEGGPGAAALLSELISGLKKAAVGLAFLGGALGARAETVPAPAAAEDDYGLELRSASGAAPLRAVSLKADVDIQVSGLVARVRVRQLFRNDDDVWAEGVYSYPLPADSAVDHMKMLIGDRAIEGEIQEKQQAERTYAAARAAGRRAGLVRRERPNVFTSKVANIGPGETVAVEISYQQPVRYEAGDFSLRFPMVIRPRYTPPQKLALAAANGEALTALADRDAITPPIDDPIGGKLNPLSLRIDLDPGFALAALESLHHPIAVEDRPNGHKRIRLKAGETPADRDFMLRWRAAGEGPAAALFKESKDGFDHYLLMLVPPAADQSPQAELPREAVFIIDTSGSMGGAAIREAKAALDLALSRLAPKDRFQVIAFASKAFPLSRAAMDATPDNIRLARQWVAGLEAGGGTEMMSALALALTGAADSARLRQIVFITDGAVGNEDQLFALIRQGLGDSRLFTVGISSSPNSYFMQEAAEAGRGDYVYIARPEDVGDKMASLFAKLEHPALTGIAVRWPDGAAVEAMPDPVPDLYAGTPVSLTARAPAGQSGRLDISGRLGGRLWRESLKLGGGADNPGVAALWGRAKITSLSRDRRHGRLDPAVADRALLETALAYHLVSERTSLVAVDKGEARPNDALLAYARLASNLPHGMRRDFGGLKRTPPAPSGETAAAEAPLPQTATGWPLKILLGLICLFLGGMLLVVMRRPASWRR